MQEQHELWECERRFWLDGPDYCRSILSDDARIEYLPPVGTLSAPQLLERMGSSPRWALVEFDDTLAECHGDETVLRYRAAGWADRATPYVADCASRYRRDAGVWRMTEHRQRPVEPA